MPKEEHRWLSFYNHNRKVKLSFVIYADFESLIVKTIGNDCNTTVVVTGVPYTKKIQEHKPMSFCYYIKCNFDDRYSKLVEYVTPIGEPEGLSVAQKFVNMLEQEAIRLYKEFQFPAPKRCTKAENQDFETAKRCWICNGCLKKDNKKERDHHWSPGLENI